MKKTLSQRIAEKAFQKKLSQKGKNLASVLALRQDIQDALKDGWPIKSIWQTLYEEGKINFSYQAFRGYVNRLTLISNKTEKTEEIAQENQKIENKKQDPKNIKSQELPGFTFNPIPNKEDLL